ncbi:YdeI/OmpD-associated family protein [Dyadobacter sp. CY356]|uniref:YdeI/OmpD-associated family protein n=1 Tax=Dyadobacter sp. CY356 TaxID=2906442 RepID=UPI001F177FFE|nr:YdeI/OmpD-associated family protein [Dyadobacter sp. CY356]MCF0059776.1 YdeI/OmpD-associated family protein [Dyadobacter sp. CY356]
MSVTFKSAIHHLEHLAGTRYLLVPGEIVEKLGGSFSIRLWCTVNEKIKWQCGLVALGTGDAYISINAQRIKQLKAKADETFDVALEVDDSEYGLEVPEELKELLDQDDEGNSRFNQLVAGKRRFIIRHITAVKSSQLRIERAVTLIKNLKRLPIGKEGFKEILGK